MAVEKVRERLLRAAGALERHGVPYAVIGGNAVALWVSRVDEDAVRSTKDIDILLQRADLERAASALGEAGFHLVEVMGVAMFVEHDDPSPRRGVHVVYAGEFVRPGEAHPAPGLDAVEWTQAGFTVIDLHSLLVMKLTAFRRLDCVHLNDMLEVGLITPEVEARLPADLRERLERVRRDPE